MVVRIYRWHKCRGTLLEVALPSAMGRRACQWGLGLEGLASSKGYIVAWKDLLDKHGSVRSAVAN